MIYVTGDTHGALDIRKLSSEFFKEGTELTKEDYVVILGDFGLVFDIEPAREEEYWLTWLTMKPWTTLFVDGNHENFERLNRYPVIDFMGGKASQIHRSVYHLKRGCVFDIDGKKFFVMGGAMSRDKEHRRNRISWWQEEIPNYREIDYALANLEKNNFSVDYVFTHTCPNSTLNIFPRKEKLDTYYLNDDPAGKILDEILDRINFNRWYFGHFHDDWDEGKMSQLYQRVIKVE